MSNIKKLENFYPRAFWRNHLLLPALFFTSIFLLIEISGIDFIVADKLYALQGHEWALKNHWLTQNILHHLARKVLVVMALLIIIAAVLARWLQRLTPWRSGLVYLAITMPVSSGIIALLKRLSHMDCPWSLLAYGGNNPFVSLWTRHPQSFEFGHCFPAGHAGAGYTLVAFYFFCLAYRPQFRHAALMVALLIGLVFGFTQQLRGAHFLSHDLVSLAICWFTSLTLYIYILHTHAASISEPNIDGFPVILQAESRRTTAP